MPEISVAKVNETAPLEKVKRSLTIHFHSVTKFL